MTLDTSVSTSGLGRLFRGQTAIDFYGKRKVGLVLAVVAVILPGAGFETTFDGCLARLETAPSRPWLLKRPFGFSGRMRKTVVPQALDRAAITWIEASMTGYGGGLQVEPLVERIADFGLHGRLGPRGELTRGQPVSLRCGPDGRFLGARPTEPGELSEGEMIAFDSAFAGAADALRVAGYFGPFGIDAFACRDADGVRRFHPLSEINARYSMAWWTGMAPHVT